LAEAVSAISRAPTPTDLLALVTQRAASLSGVVSAAIFPAATVGVSGGERIPIEPDVVAPSSLVVTFSPNESASIETRSMLSVLCRVAASRLDVLSLAPGAVPLPPRSREIAADEMRASILALTRDLPGVVFRCKNEPERSMEFISDACLAFLGHSASEFVQRSVDLSSLIVADDRHAIWRAIQDALARREAYEVSYRFHAGSGELRWAHERGRGLVDNEGEVFAIAGIILDDTARRRAEESVVRAERDLHEAHARLELTLDAADVGFWEYDVTSAIASHSNSWKRQLGLENEVLASVASTFADRLHPDDRERALLQGAQLLDGTIERVDGEYRLLHRDGAYRTILNRGAAFRDASGKVIGLRGVHIDVSNRRAAEEATRRVHELAEQNRAVQTASRFSRTCRTSFAPR
jgi:PAS domain S-box-containing protein